MLEDPASEPGIPQPSPRHRRQRSLAFLCSSPLPMIKEVIGGLYGCGSSTSVVTKGEVCVCVCVSECVFGVGGVD